jgi:hypothetical protein
MANCYSLTYALLALTKFNYYNMMESNHNDKDKVNSNGSTNGNGSNSNGNNSNNNDSMLDKQLLHKILDLCKSPKVPDKATVRYEYVKVKVKDKGKGESEGEVRVKVYGPYLYAYWRENGKLKKRYMGKSINDYMLRVLAYEYDVDANFLREYRIMKWLAEHGDRYMYTLLYALNRVNDQALKRIIRRYKLMIYMHIIDRLESDDEFRRFLLDEL